MFGELSIEDHAVEGFKYENVELFVEQPSKQFVWLCASCHLVTWTSPSMHFRVSEFAKNIHKHLLNDTVGVQMEH